LLFPLPLPLLLPLFLPLPLPLLLPLPLFLPLLLPLPLSPLPLSPLPLRMKMRCWMKTLNNKFILRRLLRRLDCAAVKLQKIA
jgi:hypothetical protein